MVAIIEWHDSNLESLIIKESKKTNSDKFLVYNRKTEEMENVNLSVYQRIKLKINSSVKVDERQYKGWTGKLPFYVYSCKVSGKKVYFIDYPHGYSGRLDCKL